MGRTKVRRNLAATLALAAVAAVGAVSTAAAPAAATDQNAVVHWSGVAAGAIAAGRPPASSTVLAGMVHGAIYDAVAAVEEGLDPFVTDVSAAAGASADAAVAQAARDILVTRIPGQSAQVQTAYDAFMATMKDLPSAVRRAS